MKALTILQPWASAIALGAKTIETRSWKTNYRGRILIHAGASRAYLPYQRRGIPRRPDRHVIGNQAMQAAGIQPDYLFPLGALIAVATLSDCMRAEDVLEWGSDHLTGWDRPTESFLGDYADGRYAWLLTDVEKLAEPVLCKGRLGIYNVAYEIDSKEAE